MKNFIKSLKRPENETLIEAILEGYNVIFENNEVADLVTEARKYKTADEFVKALQKDVFYHGTPTGKFGPSAIHIGTQEAAKQALEARIGIRADGKLWDGTSEYGETLLAGKKTLQKLDPRGNNLTGFNCDVPENDFYLKDRPDLASKSKFGDGTKIPLTAKPDLFPVKIKGDMTNYVSTPMSDMKANATIKAMLKKKQAKRGYFYKNDGEDEGSISAVVPTQAHLERNLTKSQLIGIWNKAHSPQLGDEMDQSTRGINESADLYASGMCDVFALALNKLYGYEPYVVRGYYKDGDEYAYEDSHAVVKSPKGFLDYKGLISEQELKKTAHFTNNIEFVKIEPVTVTELEECFTSEPIPKEEIEKAVEYIEDNNSLFESKGKSELQILKDNKVPLTDEERKEVFKKDAVWHYSSSIDPNTGEKVQKVSAVWKSKHPKTGDITYITNTHRAYNTAKSLDAIINKYHNFIKETA